MKVLITGMPGTGKSSIIKELQNLGYAAFNTDDMHDVTKFEDKITGKLINISKNEPADFNNRAWRWQTDALKELLNSDETVIIGASVENQNRHYHLFDKIIALLIDDNTMQQRLSSRLNNPFGKHPQDIAAMVAIHERVDNELRNVTSNVIDASQPLNSVVKEIIKYIGNDNEY